MLEKRLKQTKTLCKQAKEAVYSVLNKNLLKT